MGFFSGIPISWKWLLKATFFVLSFTASSGSRSLKRIHEFFFRLILEFSFNLVSMLIFWLLDPFWLDYYHASFYCMWLFPGTPIPSVGLFPGITVPWITLLPGMPLHLLWLLPGIPIHWMWLLPGISTPWMYFCQEFHYFECDYW